MRLLALAFLAACATAAPEGEPPERLQDYVGEVTGGGVENGRITVHVAGADLVTGALSGRVQGRPFNVALHGSLDKGTLTLAPQPETASARDLRFTVESVPDGFQGQVEGELHGQALRATFLATRRADYRPPENTNGH